MVRKRVFAPPHPNEKCAMNWSVESAAAKNSKQLVQQKKPATSYRSNIRNNQQMLEEYPLPQMNLKPLKLILFSCSVDGSTGTLPPPRINCLCPGTTLLQYYNHFLPLPGHFGAPLSA